MSSKKSSSNLLIAIIMLVALMSLSFIVLVTLFFIAGDTDLASLTSDKVGIISIKGEIVSESTSSVFDGSKAGARELIRLIEKADDDPLVPVIFLDINSGGGSVVASKEIMRAVRAAEKPVVAYIADVGASGAYYVASAADEIYADEDSLTGSIGVVALFPNYVGLMEKIGYNVTILKRGDNKVALNPYEVVDEADKALFDVLLEDAFQNFRRDVLENRAGRIIEETFDEVADGRVLNGRQALEAGLIDKLGSRQDALNRAGQLGGIEGEPDVKNFRPNLAAPLPNIFGSSGYDFAVGLLKGLQSQKIELRAEVL